MAPNGADRNCSAGYGPKFPQPVGKDNFDSIEGLEGLVNLSNILPNQTEIDNFDVLDEQDAFAYNH